MDALSGGRLRFSGARRVLIALAWLAALGVAFALDGTIARGVRESELDHHVYGSRMAAAIKPGGHFFFTLIVAVLLSLFHRLRWRAGLFLCACGIGSGINWLIKWAVGRTRPFKLPANVPQPAPFLLQPFKNGWHGLIHSPPALDFPSGHASLTFATAAALAVLIPRWRVLFYALAVVVAAERVAENAHYLSDVVAGAALGVLVVACMKRWIGPFLLGRTVEGRI